MLPGTKFLTAKSLNNRSLEQFNAPEGVVYVGNEVFRFNSPKGVDLPSTVLKLYDSFYVAEGVETVALRATAVPEYTNDLFYKCPNATLYVPDASVDAYKAATAFAVVKQILPLSQYSAVKDVTAAETSAEVTAIYGIDGSVRTPCNQASISYAIATVPHARLCTATDRPLRQSIYIASAVRMTDLTAETVIYVGMCCACRVSRMICTPRKKR